MVEGKPCNYFMQGNCKYGASCKFSHNISNQEQQMMGDNRGRGSRGVHRGNDKGGNQGRGRGGPPSGHTPNFNKPCFNGANC